MHIPPLDDDNRNCRVTVVFPHSETMVRAAIVGVWTRMGRPVCPYCNFIRLCLLPNDHRTSLASHDRRALCNQSHCESALLSYSVSVTEPRSCNHRHSHHPAHDTLDGTGSLAPCCMGSVVAAALRAVGGLCNGRAAKYYLDELVIVVDILRDGEVVRMWLIPLLHCLNEQGHLSKSLLLYSRLRYIRGFYLR